MACRITLVEVGVTVGERVGEFVAVAVGVGVVVLTGVGVRVKVPVGTGVWVGTGGREGSAFLSHPPKQAKAKTAAKKADRIIFLPKTIPRPFKSIAARNPSTYSVSQEAFIPFVKQVNNGFWSQKYTMPFPPALRRFAWRSIWN